MENYKTKKAIIQTLGPCGLQQAVKLMTGNYTRVLMYHRFSSQKQNGKLSVDTFALQIAELKKRFNVLPLTTVLDCISKGNTIPRNSIVITIDDGYLDFYQYAFPVLKLYEATATIYITTEFINRKIWLWPDKITYILECTEQTEIRLDTETLIGIYTLKTDVDRQTLWNKLINYCIGVETDVRENFITWLAGTANVNIDLVPPHEYAAMSWDNIKDISDHGMDIGAHTRTHPILSKLRDRKRLEDEVAGCKMEIEARIGKTVTNFCYPNGQMNDYNDRIKKVIVKSGFKSAATAFYDKRGWADLFEFRRHGVGDDMYHFKRVVYGFEYLGAWL